MNRAMIFVKDLHRMAAFYGGTMRLKPIDDSRTDSWVEFDAGGIRLALHAIPSHIAENIEITQPPRAREDNPLKLIFVVDDLEARISSLEAKGVKIIRQPWGACDVIDPEGNIFQICCSTKSNEPASK